MDTADQAERWQCEYCGYLYDPAVGDPDEGIAPGTPFSALPSGWCCPNCGAEQDGFHPVGA